MKKISVIVPCYNAEKIIDKCLHSIMSQTYRDIEIVLINDGSKDNTFDKLKYYEKKDDRIVVINQENQGLAKTRTDSIVLAKGDFIMFVDQDDWLEKNTIEKVFQVYKDEDVVFFSYMREYSHKSIRRNFNLSGSFSATQIQRRIVGLIENEFPEIGAIDSLVTIWGKLYRNNNILRNLEYLNLSEIGTWDDGIFNLQVLEKSNKVLIIDEPYYHYRKYNDNSITSSYKEHLYQKWKKKFFWIKVFLDTNKKSPEFYRALNNRICITTLNLAFNEMNSNKTFGEKKLEMRKILNDDFYKKAFSEFELKNLPFIWKIFYYFAKTKNAFAVTLLSGIIYGYINRKN